MNNLLYEMIFKRKSFHIFKDIGTIEPGERGVKGSDLI